MNEVRWNDRFNLGVDTIDKTHQRLFSIIGKLIALNEDTTKQQHACREGIKYLKNYTLKHFAEEEDYMLSINYDGYDMHKSLHENMRDKTLPALEKELEEQNYSVESVRHFLGICVGWLNGHIMVEDYAITGRTSNKWTHHPSEDKMVSLEKSIVQGLQDLFRRKAHLVSEHYSGEDFSDGNKICFRLNYLSKEKTRLQVFLIYEERLALHTLSEMLGRQLNKADKTVLYAIKILSQQFVEHVGTHFNIKNMYQLEKNDMLTFDQFLRTFDKTYPDYSLLFSTEGNGYFAFCIR